MFEKPWPQRRVPPAIIEVPLTLVILALVPDANGLSTSHRAVQYLAVLYTMYDHTVHFSHGGQKGQAIPDIRLNRLGRDTFPKGPYHLDSYLRSYRR